LANAFSWARLRRLQTDRAALVAACFVLGCGPSEAQEERQRVAVKIDAVRDATTVEGREEALKNLEATRATTREASRARATCMDVYRNLNRAQLAVTQFDVDSKDLQGLLRAEADLAKARADMPECEDAIGALKLAR
jgi:hypothetical protein